MKARMLLVALFAATLSAQNAPPRTAPLDSLSFLEGSWNAAAVGSTGAQANGYYVFRRELGDQVLARHSFTAACKGPADYNCAHADLLFVYSDGAGTPLKAIYFDSEGHTIHYNVSTPDANTALFLSDAALPGPQFRLIYTRKGETLTGKFQMRMPGHNEWNSYLEWSGDRRREN